MECWETNFCTDSCFTGTQHSEATQNIFSVKGMTDASYKNALLFYPGVEI